MTRATLLLSLVFGLTACAATAEVTVDPPAEAAPPAATAHHLAFADIPFAPFNPEQPEGIHVYPISGDPAAGAFNAVVRFPPGLMMPLHTHTYGYSGVALSEGLVHGSASDSVHPVAKGSVWYQPAGEPHTDGCEGDAYCYFLVFFEGAVDVTPAEAPSASPTAVVWPPAEIPWAELKGGIKMAVIHGNPKEGAFHALIDFPAGMATNVHTHSASFAAALLSGTHHRGVGPDALVTLEEGAVWSEPAEAPHMEKCGADSRCVMAVSMDGPLDTKAVELTPAE